MLEFRILGPLEVSDGGAPVRLGGPKQRATLAILLLGVNRVVSVDRLADDLYVGEPPVTAVTQVQRQVSELRKALGDASVIETRAPGYVLRLAPEQLDLARFERLAAEAGRSEPARAAELLREALGIWRGDPLADLAAEPFAHLAVHRLDEIRLAALEQRIDADLALGRHRELVGELETLVAEEPLRERFRAQLMLALYRAGRQAEALDAYRAARETLVEELGIEPAPALRELERAILAHDPTLEPGAAPEPARAVLAVGAAALTAAALLPDSELIAARLLAGEEEVERAAAELTLAAPAGARVAAFTSDDAAADVVRFAAAYDVELVLLDAPAGLDGERVPADLAAVLERSPAPVAVLTRPVGGGEGVFVPFGGGEHDWAALEVGARLAAATAAPLRLVGRRRPAGAATPADCSPMRHWRSSASSASPPRPCLPIPAGWSRPWRTRNSSSSGLLRAGGRWGSAPSAARWSRRRARPCCSSTGACARCRLPRARAGRASPGRSRSSRPRRSGTSRRPCCRRPASSFP